MNTSKLIVATITAVSVFGAIGLAYAQTNTPAVTPSTNGVQQPMSPSTQGAPMDPTMPSNRGSTGTMDGTAATMPNSGGTMSGDGSGMQTERAARADRN